MNRTTAVIIACGSAAGGAIVATLIALLICYNRRRTGRRTVSIETMRQMEHPYDLVASHDCKPWPRFLPVSGPVLTMTARPSSCARSKQRHHSRSISPFPSLPTTAGTGNFRSASWPPEAPQELLGLGISQEVYVKQKHCRAPSTGQLLEPVELPAKRFSLLSIISNSSLLARKEPVSHPLTAPLNRGRSKTRKLRYQRRVEDLRSESLGVR